MTWAAQFAAFGPYLGAMLPNFAVQLTQIIGPLCGILVGPAIGAISDRSDRQTLGASIGQGWAIAGGIVIAGYIHIFGPAYQQLRSFLGMLSGVTVFSVTCACIAGRETPLEKNDEDKSSTWTQVKESFATIFRVLKTLPSTLIIYCAIFFCVICGYTAYNGNKGQFFGLEVCDDQTSGAHTCGSNCTKAQSDYNKGVSLAGGSTDLMYNIVGYVFTWVLPSLVRTFGVKWVLVVSSIPQALLMVMAFTKVVTIDAIIVAATSISQAIVFAILVPIIVHVMDHDIDIGAYVGALNSAQCFGQLLSFAIGSAIVETSLGYKLPVFLGGAFTVVGVFIAIFFFKIKMHSM
ncbi:hypothetical protein FI667_g14770, partial [Globisporangium splendens]